MKPKHLLKLVLLLAVIAALGRFFPYFAAVLVVCGLYDLLRNRKLDFGKFIQYFTGNGILTWLLSPFNTLLDLISLPFINKGIYRLEDLPPSHQAEVKRLIDSAHQQNLVPRMEELIKERSRTMIFWKWYGSDVPAVIDIPAFHEKYKYIKTIGLSVFNKKKSTSRHFGPFRATLRVLYNINTVTDPNAYIEVGDTVHRWCENKLFIFDDTLMHQSFNETDQARYCLFVDILRPSPFSLALASVVSTARFFLKSVNFVFYKNWDVIKQ